MFSKFLVVICLIFINGCRSEESATYTAAVVEVNPLSEGNTTKSVNEVTKQAIDIIESIELDGVDIVVLPEVIFNRQNTAVLLPNTNLSYCDDPAVDEVLRSISCAVRKAKKYVVIDLYVKVKCSMDDQSFCAYESDSTNLYNMAIVFDRNGDVVAKYRKYHLFNEDGVQQTKTPDLTTFRTDFNVTFGVCICFDLMFDEPAINLVDQGVKHFVYPTMWFSEIPYLTAVQYQQSWAYANNVNLLAANVNAPSIKCSGSGIYGGRSGALQVIVSESPATKILVAKIPIDPAEGNRLEAQSNSNPNTDSNESSEMILFQDDITEYTVTFLDFSRSLGQSGSVCNKAICCDYNIEVSDNGGLEGKSSYSYAISVFSGHRRYNGINNLLTGQEVCSLIACTEMNTKSSCGIRTSPSQVHNRYNFTKLSLKTVLPVTYMKAMPNTLTADLLPLNVKEFEYKISKIKEHYVVELHLNVPKSNLLTFAIFSRDYDKDVITNGTESSKMTTMITFCVFSSIIWMRCSHYVNH
ncbi:vanin-like protein 1 [Sitodiplosis mosellana]|uniref:vanin-like protein 1 n=1 Tax=Sitodiplosis mosellana TaxID=263140 RepID=UPI002443A592|nr:vanin-like protein 1 [Sitodiplosis mosellana]XP_055305812.1 vanin-like protein 1 [Sitodiplosis mosellana]